MNKKTIQPSLLAFDPKKMPNQLTWCVRSGIEIIHFDVMDGLFVPNKAFEPETLDLLHQFKLKASVHLMTKNVVANVEKYLNHPCVESIFIHVYADHRDQIIMALDLINQNPRIKSGIALKNTISIGQELLTFLRKVDLVLMMGVTPGAGGQKYMKTATLKLSQLKKYINDYRIKASIILDGGVNCQVIEDTQKYVDHYVIGSFLMQSSDLDNTYQQILRTINNS